MELKQAKREDAERLEAFYKNAVADPDGMNRYTRWVYGLHPSDEMIERYVTQGAMYLLEDEQGIAAACALTPSQDESYHTDVWKQLLADEEVSVLHILCVDPARVRQGYGRAKVNAAVSLAEKCGKKALRLDALSTNVPAQRLYESLGFEKRGLTRLFTRNLGWADFCLYEMPLNG